MDNPKAIERARWILAEYREISPKHVTAGQVTTAGDMIADIRYMLEFTFGLDWRDVESVSYVALESMKREVKP
jgi:hypothetical protein